MQIILLFDTLILVHLLNPDSVLQFLGLIQVRLKKRFTETHSFIGRMVFLNAAQQADKHMSQTFGL